MLTGGFTFALIIGSLGALTKKSGAAESVARKETAFLNNFCNARGVSTGLFRRMRLYFSDRECQR